MPAHKQGYFRKNEGAIEFWYSILDYDHGMLPDGSVNIYNPKLAKLEAKHRIADGIHPIIGPQP